MNLRIRMNNGRLINAERQKVYENNKGLGQCARGAAFAYISTAYERRTSVHISAYHLSTVYVSLNLSLLSSSSVLASSLSLLLSKFLINVNNSIIY